MNKVKRWQRHSHYIWMAFLQFGSKWKKHILPLSWEDAKGGPWPAERHNLCSISYICPRLSFQFDTPKKPSQGDYCEAQTTSTCFLHCKGVVTQPQDPPECLSSSPYNTEPSYPVEEAYFGHLYPQSSSFGHYSQLVTIGLGWGSEHSSSSKLKVSLSGSAHSCHNASICLSISCSTLPSLTDTWTPLEGCGSPLTQSGQSTFFWVKPWPQT